MTTQIFKDYSAFLAREDKDINGVSQAFANLHPDFEKQNQTNKVCWNCFGCSDCFRCSDCSDNKNKEGEEKAFVVPALENIHQKIFQAASKPNALNMRDWHTCETTHCQAGWVTHLAGEAGKTLEQKTSTLFAAMQIYKASSPIRVFHPAFFANNESALADMERCAKEEGLK